MCRMEDNKEIKYSVELAAAFTDSIQLNGTLYSTANSSLNSSRSLTFFPYYQHSLPVAASFILAYLFIFLLCMLGNVMVCLIVLRDRRMRTVTNLFILNLAVSDLLVGIFCIPTTLVDNLITGWPFTNTVCKMSGLVQGMSVSASVFTLVAIAVDRFRCIVHPFQAKITLLVAKSTIVMIWVLALVIMCPSAAMLTVQQVEDHYMVYNEDFNHTYPLYTCYENWPQPEMQRVYTTVLFAHIYLAPLTLITLMYSRIGVKLCTTHVFTSTEQREGAPIRSANPFVHQERRSVVSHKKIRVIKMLIMVALLFMLSWLPLWTLMLLTDYGILAGEQLESATGYIFPFAHWLAFSNSSVNPIIYGYYNENFKRGFQAFWQLYSCCSWQRKDDRALSLRDGQARDSGLRDAAIGFGPRNRVHTDGDPTESVHLELEWRRTLTVGSSLPSEKRKPGNSQGVTCGPNRIGAHIEESGKITPIGAGVYQAWDI